MYDNIGRQEVFGTKHGNKSYVEIVIYRLKLK